MVITPEPLTLEKFAPFGDVIAPHPKARQFKINQNFSDRFHSLSKIDVAQGQAGISIIRTQVCKLPFRIGILERHPLGSQSFIPLSDDPYLVTVCPPGDLDLSKLKVFYVTGQLGVNYHRGTWHHFCLPLKNSIDYIVIDRLEAENNCEEQEISFDQEITIQINSLDF